MSNVTYLKPRIKSDFIVKLRPSGSYSIGRSHPPKNDKHYQVLEGIHSELDFRGAKIDKPVTVVSDANGIQKIFKQNNISVVEDREVATVYETSNIDGEKVCKIIEVIPHGKELKGYYLTKAGILVRPIQKVSIESRQPDPIESDPDRLERISLDYEKAGNQEMADFFGDRYAYEVFNSARPLQNVDHLIVDGDDLAVAPLGLSDATNCHNGFGKKDYKPAKRGSKGITTKGRHLVQEAGFLLEQKYGKDNLSFLTVTLPAFYARNELELICLSWSDLIRKFIQELKRILKRRGYPVSMVWVTEIQEDRYRETGDVCPHLHLVMIGKKHRYQKGYAIHFSEVRSLWERILSNFLDRAVTCQAGTRVERPRKSLCAELGKYMSKGGKIIKDIIKDGKADMLPSSYAGCTDNLKRAIAERTTVLRGAEALKFVDNQEDMKLAGLLFYKPIIIYAPNLGRDITVGFVGWIKEKAIVSEFLAA